MSSVINVIHGVNAIARATSSLVDVAVDASDLICSLDNDVPLMSLKKISIVSRTAIAALSIIDLIRCISGEFSYSTTMGIKLSEMMIRGIDMPFQVVKVCLESKEFSKQTVIKVMEKFASCMAGIISTQLDMGKRAEQYYLEQYEKDPNAERPIYGHSEGRYGNVVIGYEKIDPDVCKKNIESLDIGITTFSTVELITSLSPLENAYRAIALRHLGQYLAAVNNPPPNNPPPANRVINNINRNPVPNNINRNPVQHQPVQQNQNINIFDLRESKNIPPELNDDLIFKKYICSITLEPIRFPVQDPTADGSACVLYERDAIALWVALKGISPMTRRSLSVDELLPRPDIQSLIEKRLDFHSIHVKAEILKNLDAEEAKEEVEVVEEVADEKKENH